MGVKHLMNYHKEKDEIASTEQHTVFKEVPVHDAACHAADAFGHGCLMVQMCELEGRIPGHFNKKVTGPAAAASDAAGITDKKLMEV